MDAFEQALVAELARTSGLVWVGYGNPVVDHPVWHVWSDGYVCVVAGGGEQPLPGITDADAVVLTLRSKATRHTVARVAATVERLTPTDPSWPATTTALAAARLHLADGAVERWAAEGVVVRLRPQHVLEGPGHLAGSDQRAAPRESTATTVDRRPWSVRPTRRAIPPLTD